MNCSCRVLSLGCLPSRLNVEKDLDSYWKIPYCVIIPKFADLIPDYWATL